MSREKVEKIEKHLDLDRTNDLFDVAITRSGAKKSNNEWNEEDLKKQKLLVGFGNLHINTAKAKITAIRMIGYVQGLVGVKKAVERKTRNKRKYN